MIPIGANLSVFPPFLKGGRGDLSYQLQHELLKILPNPPFKKGDLPTRPLVTWSHRSVNSCLI